MKFHVCLPILITLLLMPCTKAFAQDTTPLTQDELISLVGEAIVEEAADASDELRKAKEILDTIRNRQSSAQEQAQAESELNTARSRYNKAQKNLDTARVNAFADQCDKSPAEIQAMRDSGWGWGQIAKECGLHPSASGKGKGKNKNTNKGRGNGNKKKK